MSAMIICPICNKYHHAYFIEISDIQSVPKDEEYHAHFTIYAYCNFSDKGMTFYSEGPDFP